MSDPLEDYERRLEILRRGTAALVWSFQLPSSTSEEAEQLLARAEPTLVRDPETLALLRAVVDAKRARAIWGPAVMALRRRGEQLERRAYRSPRRGATALAGIWGGRRWRTLNR